MSTDKEPSQLDLIAQAIETGVEKAIKKIRSEDEEAAAKNTPPVDPKPEGGNDGGQKKSKPTLAGFFLGDE